MPPKKKRGSEKYAQDDFIVEESGSEPEPEPKRSKTAKNPKEKSKVTPVVPSGKKLVDEEGNDYWELGGRLRRVTLSEFKGKTLINIREHYEKDGKVLPGKKGISLSTEQFSALLSVLPQIEASLADKDITLPRPDYGEALKAKEEGEQEEEEAAVEEEQEEEEEEEEAEKTPPPKKKPTKKKE